MWQVGRAGGKAETGRVNCSSVADLVVAHLIRQLLKLRGVASNVQLVCAALWLFNPFTFAVATRGNCEALVCAVLLWMLICLMTGMCFSLHFFSFFLSLFMWTIGIAFLSGVVSALPR